MRISWPASVASGKLVLRPEVTVKVNVQPSNVYTDSVRVTLVVKAVYTELRVTTSVDDHLCLATSAAIAVDNILWQLATTAAPDEASRPLTHLAVRLRPLVVGVGIAVASEKVKAEEAAEMRRAVHEALVEDRGEALIAVVVNRLVSLIGP